MMNCGSQFEHLLEIMLHHSVLGSRIGEGGGGLPPICVGLPKRASPSMLHVCPLTYCMCVACFSALCVHLCVLLGSVSL